MIGWATACKGLAAKGTAAYMDVRAGLCEEGTLVLWAEKWEGWLFLFLNFSEAQPDQHMEFPFK